MTIRHILTRDVCHADEAFLVVALILLWFMSGCASTPKPISHINDDLFESMPGASVTP